MVALNQITSIEMTKCKFLPLMKSLLKIIGVFAL